jgi:hypothetical protein
MRRSKKGITFASTLETRTQIPDVHCAPLGIREKHRSFPYRTMGMSGFIFGGGFFRKKFNSYPKWVMRAAQAGLTRASPLETGTQIPDVHCAPLGIRDKHRSFPYRTMGMSGFIFGGGFIKKNRLIPQMGDASGPRRAYPCVNLGDRESGSGCSLRPTRHSENAAHSHIGPWEWAALLIWPAEAVKNKSLRHQHG